MKVEGRIKNKPSFQLLIKAGIYSDADHCPERSGFENGGSIRFRPHDFFMTKVTVFELYVELLPCKIPDFGFILGPPVKSLGGQSFVDHNNPFGSFKIALLRSHLRPQKRKSAWSISIENCSWMIAHNPSMDLRISVLPQTI